MLLSVNSFSILERNFFLKISEKSLHNRAKMAKKLERNFFMKEMVRRGGTGPEPLNCRINSSIL